MNFPEELKYTRDHEWIRVEGNLAYVGITEYAQGELGEIVFVDVASVGETIGQNEIFGSIEAVKTVSDLLMPVSAEVLEFNGDLDNQPELVNQNPYADGWIIKISIKEAGQLDALLSASEYKTFVGK